MLDVALLGTGGMMPLPNRYLTALLLRLNGNMCLIDCGEGTQMSMKILGWGYKNIDAICFTHFHADHISGLPGLLLTIGNSGREEALKLIGPRGMKRVYDGLRMIAPELPFEVEIIELEGGNTINVSGIELKTIKLNHKVECLGYSAFVRRVGRFDVERAKAAGVPQRLWSVLQKNESAEFEGKIFTSDMVLGPERKGIKVCYCTDSRPVEGLAEFVSEADLFICEGMYGENEKIDKAREYKHMLFKEAATIAQNGAVKQLWLTHYSPSLTEPKMFLENARCIFPKTYAGFDRKTTTIAFEDCEEE